MTLEGAKLDEIEFLKQSEGTLAQLIEAFKDCALFMLDAEGIVTTWNPGAELITGYAQENIIGQHFSLLYPQEAVERGDPNHELEIARENRHHEEEGWRVRKDKSRFWVHSIVVAVKDREGSCIGFAKIVRDLTERQNTERSREKASQILAQTNNELQRLAYVISHELQEPLANISRYSNLLSVRYKDRLGVDADEFLEHIQHSGKIVGRMIDDLWTYARITRPANFGPVKVGNVLNAVEEELKEEIKESGAKISCPAASTLPTVKANEQQLAYVFKELILNAIKHHKNEGAPSIQISTAAERNGWTFNFKDNGPGIDKFFAQQVFKIYQRLDGKPNEEGTGMGLAICKKIIEQQHQGVIGFQSLDGQGTTFFVWLPSAAEQSIAQ